jgi:hypothetical protein
LAWRRWGRWERFFTGTRLLEKVGPEAPAELVAVAKGTLGAAVASAARFGEGGAARVLEPAKEAFVASVHAIAYLSAGLFLFLSVFVAVLLRDATLEARH